MSRSIDGEDCTGKLEDRCIYMLKKDEKIVAKLKEQGVYCEFCKGFYASCISYQKQEQK